MSFLGSGFDVFDDMIIDSVVDVAGDLAEEGVAFVEDPSFGGAVGVITGYTNFGMDVGMDVAEDTAGMVENEIDPSQPVPVTTTTSTSNGVTNIYNVYYGCPRPEGGLFENAFDHENEEEEITFETDEPPPAIC